jgi:hypothetical protein
LGVAIDFEKWIYVKSSIYFAINSQGVLVVDYYAWLKTFEIIDLNSIENEFAYACCLVT